MLIRNYLEKEHPYYESKTMKQWQALKRVVREDAVGEKMYINGHRQQIGMYYTLDETRAATESELEEWKSIRREKERMRRMEKKLKKEREEAEIREAWERKKAYFQRLGSIDKTKIIRSFV